MAAELLDPPSNISPATALRLSQQAPLILKTSPTIPIPYPLSLFITRETPETWTTYENLLLACLRTGDDKSARLCLDRLVERFGETNERIMALRGAYEEAVATDAKALESLLKGYEKALKENPTNTPIRKRKIALLKSISRIGDAIAALVEYLDNSPTDAEAWAELADLYLTQGLHSQAIYCLEEVLLIAPNAWNVHARIGEVFYISVATSSSSNEGNAVKSLAESMRRFCRSIELCDDYLRGYYGLKLSCIRLLEYLSKGFKPTATSTDPANSDLDIPSIKAVQRLHESATSKLAEIIRRSASREAGWQGYDKAELIAARELLDRDGGVTER